MLCACECRCIRIIRPDQILKSGLHLQPRHWIPCQYWALSPKYNFKGHVTNLNSKGF